MPLLIQMISLLVFVTDLLKPCFLYFTVKPASFSTFRRCWLNEFPNVKVTDTDQFSKCTKCVTWGHIAEHGTPQERAEAQQHLIHHWDRVTTERRHLSLAKLLSLHEEEGFFFCEIDGMDSNKTMLPHYTTLCKDVHTDKLLQLHVCCVKYADPKRADDIYLFTNAFPHDSANTITVMHTTLTKVIYHELNSLAPFFDF